MCLGMFVLPETPTHFLSTISYKLEGAFLYFDRTRLKQTTNPFQTRGSFEKTCKKQKKINFRLKDLMYNITGLFLYKNTQDLVNKTRITYQ